IVPVADRAQGARTWSLWGILLSDRLLGSGGALLSWKSPSCTARRRGEPYYLRACVDMHPGSNPGARRAFHYQIVKPWGDLQMVVF
ncbi:hypothetical protein FB45DRAFT_902232, partial [Roridomyces roridus]